MAQTNTTISISCFCSVAKLCLTLQDSIDNSTPVSPVPHHLLEFAQVHVHWVGDAIQPSHPLSPSSPSAFSLSQHQVFSSESALCLRWPSVSASVLPKSIQGWFPLGLTGWSPCCSRDSQKSSVAPQFESINSLALSNLYGPSFTSIHDYWKNHSFDYMDVWQQHHFVGKVMTKCYVYQIIIKRL